MVRYLLSLSLCLTLLGPESNISSEIMDIKLQNDEMNTKSIKCEILKTFQLETKRFNHIDKIFSHSN